MASVGSVPDLFNSCTHSALIFFACDEYNITASYLKRYGTPLFTPETISLGVTVFICFHAKSSISDGAHPTYDECIAPIGAACVLEGRIDRSIVSYKCWMQTQHNQGTCDALEPKG